MPSLCSFLSLCCLLTFILRERGGACFGAGTGAGVDGYKFQFSRWSQGHISRQMWSLFHLFSTVGKSFGVTLQPFEYSKTLLNGHLSTANTIPKSRRSFHSLKKPLNSNTPLLCITDSYCSPNCMQTILNDPDLVDSCPPFQKDCSPSLL